MNLYIHRLLKLMFFIFVVTVVLLNAILLNTNINIKNISSKNDNFEHLKVSSSMGRSMLKICHNISDFSLKSRDYSSLLNITDFKFLLNHPDICESVTDLFMVVFIHSAVNNFAKRDVIRQTWANKNNFENGHNQVKIIFLVGQTPDLSITKKLRVENNRFQDIVQGNFVDTYRNMTYKHVMGLKWISYFCNNAKFIFKADDDIFVDIFQLIYYLKGRFGHFPQDLIACYVYKNSLANRSYRNKWREYPNKYYPDYCAGWGIIMSPDVVQRLYNISTTRPFFWIDDVFVSGVLAHDLNLNHVDIGKVVSIGDDHIDNWLKSSELTLPPMFGIPNSEIDKILLMWNKTVEYYQTTLNYTF